MILGVPILKNFRVFEILSVYCIQFYKATGHSHKLPETNLPVAYFTLG